MAKWSKMYGMPLRWLHISQTVSYHHLSFLFFCMTNTGFMNVGAVKSCDQNFHGVQMGLNHHITSVLCCTVGQMS